MNKEFQQNQALGETNEKIVRKLLLKYLPSRYGVVEGFLVDRRGIQSNQTDVIIYDQLTQPSVVFENLVEDEVTDRLIPIDSTVATIEVKTTLQGKIGEAFKNIYNTRTNLELIRPLVIPASWGEHYYLGQPTAIIFAFKGGWQSPGSLKSAIKSKIRQEKYPQKTLFDLLYVHDEEVTLGWVYGFEGGSQFLVRLCDHWETELHLTEIEPDDSFKSEGLGLSHFLSNVITFVTRFQLPQLDWLLYHYGSSGKMKYKRDSEPIFKK